MEMIAMTQSSSRRVKAAPMSQGDRPWELVASKERSRGLFKHFVMGKRFDWSRRPSCGIIASTILR